MTLRPEEQPWSSVLDLPWVVDDSARPSTAIPQDRAGPSASASSSNPADVIYSKLVACINKLCVHLFSANL